MWFLIIGHLVKRNFGFVDIFQGTAAERLHLFRLFPFNFGTKVPIDNTFWKLLLIGIDTCAFILSTVFKQDRVIDLEELIEEHNQLYVSLTGKKITPKMHYLLHYARLSMAFGPLKNVWCMRFEAMHQQFKKLARRLNNYKSITKTMTERY